MEQALKVQQEWGKAVQDLKDSEKVYGCTSYATESLARAILSFVRYTRVRQPVLFKQRRGEEYEYFVSELKKQYDPDSVLRTLENDAVWTTTFTLARRR
jgi:hypothetical protein